MRKKIMFVIGSAALAAVLQLGSPAFASISASGPTLQSDATTGAITVTLSDGTAVVVSADLAAKISAAMASGDQAAVLAAIKALIVANAPYNANLATAILLVAKASTADPALQAAAEAGVIAGNPGAATVVAANYSASPGAPGGGGGGSNTGGGGVPSGGTSGGGTGTTPSGN